MCKGRLTLIFILLALVIVAAGLCLDAYFTHLNQQDIETLEELEQRY